MAMIKITTTTTTIITTTYDLGGSIGGLDVVGAGVSKINNMQRIEDDGCFICHNSCLKISSSLKSLYLRCLLTDSKNVSGVMM